MVMRNQLDSMLTVREASRILHVHSNTLRRWTEQGVIKAYRIGPRGDRRFRLEDIVATLLSENEDTESKSASYDYVEGLRRTVFHE